MKTWDSLLIESLQVKVDKVPKGYKTTKELAAIYNKSRKAIEDMFTKLNRPSKHFKIRIGKTIRETKHWKVG